jgi:dTDP-glucose 4,6-dehydratase
MKVLVIGSSGFVGSNLNLTSPDFCFFGLDDVTPRGNPNQSYIHFEKLDFLTEKAIEYIQKLEPSFIVLLAGIQFTSPIQKRKDRKEAFLQNVHIARQAAQILNLVPTVRKLIYVSTDMVYGIQQANLIDEQCQPHPIGEYGSSKLEAERILSRFDARVVILRPRLIVGPGRVGTIKILAEFVYRNLPVPLIGKGNNRYQMLSVFDLWSAIHKCMSVDVKGVFNLGSDSPPTLNELFPEVLGKLGRKNPIIRLPQKATEKSLLLLDKLNLSPLAPEQFLIAGLNCMLSTDKFKSATGWCPAFTDLEVITESLSRLARE